MTDRDKLAALLHSTLAVDHDDDTLVVGYDKLGCSKWGDAMGECRRVADAILAAGWHPPTVSCPPDEHVLYESCGICGDIPEEISEQWDATDDSAARLRGVIAEMEAIEQARAALVTQRDALIRELLPELAGPKLAALTGLTTTGIYKICKR